MNFENNDIITILEKWSNKYKRSIDCSNPKGFSQKAHCAGRKKRKRGGKTKSRPVESLQEKTMSEKKDFIMTEIEKAISREVAKKNIRQSSKNLYEAVSAATKVLNENSSEKKKNLAESLIVVAEKKLKEDYDELDSIDSCNCGEGEGEMFKAQLLSIIKNSDT
jgi:cellobiose-specific phosphotransferase system component IIA